MIYYDVAGQRFSNPYAAFLHGASADPRTVPRFDFYDAEFSVIDWTREPSMSFQALCDTRAHQLRDRYQWLTLAFTGGTDSTTIYNTFVRNRIHIDEIFVGIGWPSDGGDQRYLQCERALQWLQKHHNDPTTKITHVEHQSKEALKNTQRRFSSSYFVAETAVATHFKYHTSPLEHLFESMSDRHHSYCIVTGFEKPTLIEKGDQIYFTFLDGTFSIVMMRPEVEFFYVTPDLPQLHAKQCHMLINHARSAKMSLEQLHHIDNYYLRAASLGRDPELFHGTSQLEKIILSDYRKAISCIDFTRPNLIRLSESMRQNPNLFTLGCAAESNDRYWRCYAENWAMLQQHTSLIEYLVKHQILSSRSQPVQTYNNFFSKLHRVK